MNKTWFIESDTGRTTYATWLEAKTAWENIEKGVLCRGDGTLLDCR